ncbi:hypothetical protein [Streptomyces sp. NPDC127038]|uniref:hypothetical protein n=1 Tax=Streptomyces sp. NPDC127038 TaxID=3347114 RepID=UPI003648551B
MQRHSGGYRAATAPDGGPDPRRIRLAAFAGAVVSVLALPLTVASAGPVVDGGSPAARGSAPADGRPRVPGPRRSPPPSGLGPAPVTAARCGPELSSPDGVEAQTCVLTRGGETWARTYYRNATGDPLSSALTLMGPGGRTVQMDCAVDAEDDPGECETPGQRTTGDPGAYSAIAEFARGADEPLLLRSGSNSGREQGD